VASGSDGEQVRGPRATVTISRLNDLVALSDADLAACLNAMRQELVAARWKHEAAVASGAAAESKAFRFDRFVWQRAKRPVPAVPITPETPVSDLPFARPALDSLRAHGMEFLCDLAKACERDLLGFQDLGPTTVAGLRRLLQAAGLDFATPTARQASERRRNMALQQLTPEELRAVRAQLDDDAPASRLGLHPRTLAGCLRAGWLTVGMLRVASLAEMAERLGKASLREVCHALEQTSVGLGPGRTPLALWRVGALPVSSMVRPTSLMTPIEEFEPWLGPLAKDLASAGLGSLGHLTYAQLTGTLERVPGLTRRDLRVIKELVDAL